MRRWLSRDWVLMTLLILAAAVVVAVAVSDPIPKANEDRRCRQYAVAAQQGNHEAQLKMIDEECPQAKELAQ